MNQGLLILILLLLIALILYKLSSTEGFADIIPDLSASQQRFNPFGALINLANPQVNLSDKTNQLVKQATNSIQFKGGPGAYKEIGIVNENQIPTAPPPSLEIAQTVCEVVRSDTFDRTICNKFNDPTFAENCGISFDLKSMNSKGENHGIGGLYLNPRQKAYQKDHANGDISPEYIYTPTYGSTAVGTFTVDKETCLAIVEETECKQKKSFDVPNCAQCFSSSEFHRVNPDQPLIPPSLVLMTNAHILGFTLQNGTNVIPMTQKRMSGPETPDLVNIPGLKEGSLITIDMVRESIVDTFQNFNAPSKPPPDSKFNDDDIGPDNFFVAGFIMGQTRKGMYKLDIKYLINDSDGYNPRFFGTKRVAYKDNVVQCYAINPDPKKSLTIRMPFSFASIASNDSKQCDNGPFITTAASAAFMDSDPCHKAGAGPGTYSDVCLNQLFKGSGGTDKGTGSPMKPEGLKQILFNGNQSRTLEEIGDFLMEQGIKASTGLYNGISLSREEWNAARMFMTGDNFTDPCEGPITDACIQSLYTNPKTYNLPEATYASLNKNNLPVFCTADGLLNPMRPEGLEAVKGLTKDAVISKYRSTLETANNNKLTNDQRKQALSDCYGTILSANTVI